MIIPFGVYRGYRLDEVSTEYLVYMYDHYDINVFDGLVDAIRQELYMRFNIRTIELDGCNNPQVKRIFRELAKKYHSDTGGNDIAMQALNEFYERIKNI